MSNKNQKPTSRKGMEWCKKQGDMYEEEKMQAANSILDSSAKIMQSLLDKNKVLKEQLEKYKGCAENMYLWLDAYMGSKPTIDKTHPVHDLIREYEKLKAQE